MIRRILSASLFTAIPAAIVLPLTVARADMTATLDIHLDQKGPSIPPSFSGLMTEEINHSYDGGLYAELIQNRSFQDDSRTPRHWSLVGGIAKEPHEPDAKTVMALDTADPVNKALPVSLRVDLAASQAAVANDGFWGIPVRPDTTYTASFYAKGKGFGGALTAAIVNDEDGTPVAQADTKPLTEEWKKYTLTLTTGHDAPTTSKAKFIIQGAGNGSFSLSMVSLFPPTYMDHVNGLRPDLMKMMADLQPGFIRLPGGNYLEGNTFPTRFNWKNMIGSPEQRPGHMGCWGYRSSDGFGMPEYLLWCKQLGAEPVLAVFAGYTLNHDHVSAGPGLQPYVDEALEEIEYVSGPATSTWGKQRVADGLPEPFKLRYVEVGNEDGFDQSGSYDGRFAQFFDAIKARYPQLKVIATAPVRSRKPDLLDEHFYQSARQMAATSNRYDGMNRNGPQIFVGEWATQEGRPLPDLNAGLADAAWMMGLERNADLVQIQCYAPLFANVNNRGWEWPTNLIGYDALHSFGSPSYYVHRMFAQNRGDLVVPATFNVGVKVAATEPVPHGAIGVGTWHTNAEFKDIIVTHGDQILLSADLTKETSGWRFTGDKWDLQNAVIKPSASDSETWATTGDVSWTDYTLKLKARKVSGNEGFLVLFHVQDGQNYSWLNVGGWGDTRTRCEATHEDARTEFGQRSTFKVETGKWYDLRLEVAGNRVRCYVDDQLITDATERPQPLAAPLYATASYSTASNDVIVKLVNMGKDAGDVAINLNGAASIASKGRAIVLTGQPRDVNTLDQPEKIVPQEESITPSASFHRQVAPYSVTLLRIGAPLRTTESAK